MGSKRILITTVVLQEIAKTARVPRRPVSYSTGDDCFAAANNIEFINGFTLPNHATQFLKANLPSIDILEYPTWEEYQEALSSGYDVVGISFWMYTSPEAIEMARQARESGVGEVWGGGHGTSTPGIEQYFDRTFSGYAEFQLKELIEGERLTKITHPILTSQYDFFLQTIPTGYLFSVRGCRMSCEFCSGPRYYGRLCYTPIEEVERVLDVYRDQGIQHITLIDETFLQSPSHAKTVLAALKKRNMTFTCTSRIDHLIGRISELKEMGLRNIYTGIESMNNGNLISVKKGESSELTPLLMQELHENGCFAFGTYIIGLDADTRQSVKEDIEKLSLFNSLYGVVFWIATPFPKTAYYERMEQHNLINDRDPKHYDALHLVWNHPNLTTSDANELLRWAVRHHCHPYNIRKNKILKAWDMLESKDKDYQLEITAHA